MCSKWLCVVCISALCVCVCVGQFGVGLGSECAAGGFVVFVYRHCVCCVWDSLVWVWGSECAAGGFVLFVYRHCVAVSRGNYMSPVLKTINFYEYILGYL